MEVEIAQEQAEQLTVSSLWKVPHLRRGFALGCAAICGQSATGINAIIFFTTVFFGKAGLDRRSAQLGTVAMSGLNFVATAASILLVERLGRRRLLLLTLSGVLISLLTYVGFAESFSLTEEPGLGYACIAAILLFIALYSLGPGPLPWFVITELMPHNARSAAQGLCMVAGNVVNLVLVFVALPAYEAIGAFSFLPLFVLPTAAILAFLYRRLPETKNREIGDIVKDLQAA